MSSAIVSFGETMLRLSPPHSVRLEEAHTFTSYVGGTESNTLAALARLGLETIWVSALPSNPLGQRVEAEVRRHGVNTSHVVWSGRDARLGLFYAEEAPNPLGLQVYYDRASSACALIDPEVVDYTVVDGARLLHLTGITPALSSQTREAFTRFLEHARQKNVPLSFDVNYRAKLWEADEAAIGIEVACQQADLLFCTRTDAASLWGMTGSTESVLRQMAQRFIGNGTPKTMVLTLGSEGAAELRPALKRCITGDIASVTPRDISESVAEARRERVQVNGWRTNMQRALGARHADHESGGDTHATPQYQEDH